MVPRSVKRALASAASASKTITIEVNRKWPKRDAVRHGGAITRSVRPLHTENTRNRALRPCLLRDQWLDGKNGLVAEYAGMLKVKRSCSNRHNRGGVEARPASMESETSVNYVTGPSYTGDVQTIV